MYFTDETADMMARDYDEDMARMLSGQDDRERFVSEADWDADDREREEACARGEHDGADVHVYINAQGRMGMQCEECPRP